MNYIIFKDLKDNKYAIKFENLKSVNILKDYTINENQNINNFVYGFINVNSEPFPLIVLDKWLNHKVETDINKYNLFLHTKFNENFYPILIKEVVGIVENVELIVNEYSEKINSFFYHNNDLVQMINYDLLITDIVVRN